MAKFKFQARLRELRGFGATDKEATKLVLQEQEREIKRLKALLDEALGAMDQDEADKFFGVGQ